MINGLPLLLVVSLMSWANAATAGDWTGSTTTVDGVVHVHNLNLPMTATVTVEATEMWRVGGYSEAEDEIFGAIVDVLRDDQGNTYVLDQQLSNVSVFDEAGAFVGTIGRDGEGPGEFRLPTSIFLVPEKGLGVVQAMSPRIVVLKRSGVPLPNLPIPGNNGFRFIERIVHTGKSILVAQRSTKLESGKAVVQGDLLSTNVDGTPVATLWSNSYVPDPVRMVVGESPENSLVVWDVGLDGSVYISPDYEKYLVRVVNTDAELVRVIDREYESRERSAEEIESVRQQVDHLPTAVADMDVSVSRCDRDIQQLFARRDGGFWVMSSRGLQRTGGHGPGVFDVFDREGRYSERVRLAVNYVDGRDLWFLRGEKLYVVKEGIGGIENAYAGMRGATSRAEEGEFQPPEVVCYSLEVGFSD